jgi:mono/diheme cytochrome c family protein
MSSNLSLALLISLFALMTACQGRDATDNASKAPQIDAPTKAKEEKASKPPPQPIPAPSVTAGGTLEQGAADAGPRGDAEKGGPLYATYCAACHQKDGKGMSGALAADFVNDISRLAKSDSVLLSSIANGVKGKLVMPPQKDTLDPAQRKDVLAYIRVKFGSKFVAPHPGG